MAESFIGEIRMFGGNFAPRGWAFCSGQVLSISQNDALFTLLGTTFGGNGETTFALPDLRGRIPIHAGTGPGLSPRTLGEAAGTETVTLTQAQLPSHSHLLMGSTTAATGVSAAGMVPGQNTGEILYDTEEDDVGMHPSSFSAAGGSQPHNNMQPSLCVNFIIALEGVFPPPN